MQKLKSRNMIVFSVLLGLASVIALVATFAGSEDQVYQPGERTIPASLQPLPDVIIEGETDLSSLNRAQSTETYTIPEWGVTIDKVAIESHTITGDTVLLETSVYKDIRKTSFLFPDDFSDCYDSAVTLHRINKAQTTRDLDAKPWWTVQQELETNGGQVGDFYYYIKNSEAYCVEVGELRTLAQQALSADSFYIVREIR